MGRKLLAAAILVLALGATARAQTTTTTTSTTTSTVALPSGGPCMAGFTASGALDGTRCQTPAAFIDTTAGAVTVTLPPVNLVSFVTVSKMSLDGNAMVVQVADTSTEKIVVAGSGGGVNSISNNVPAAILGFRANPSTHRWFFVSVGTGPTP